MASAEQQILQILIVIIVGAVAARVGRHFRIPEVLPLIFAGYILGADVLKLLRPEDLQITFETLALIAIPIILFVDGIKADPVSMRQRWKTLLSVSTLAVVVTVIGIAIVGHYLIGMSWTSAFLLGAILSSTDPAAIIPMLRKLNISKRVSNVLEAETAFNDAAAIAIFFAVLASVGMSVQGAGGSSDGLCGQSDAACNFVYAFFKIFFVSIAIGAVCGLLINTVFRRVRIEKDLMLVSIVLLIVSYSLAQYMGASGVISAVVAAFLFGNYVRSHYVDSISRIYFFEAWDDISFIAVAVIFLVLGAQLQFALLAPYLIFGLLIALAFMFLVRPFTIFSSMFFDNTYSFKEKMFISWIGGPRGAVSAALAAIILSKSTSGELEGTEFHAYCDANTPSCADPSGTIMGITIMVILTTVVITSLSARFAAKRLLRVSEEPLEFKYRQLSSELKMTMAAAERLKDDYRTGLINAKVHRELSSELQEHEERIEKELEVLSEQKPAFEGKEKAAEVERLITAQVDRLEGLYSTGELSEAGYRDLLAKNNAALNRLRELE